MKQFPRRVVAATLITAALCLMLLMQAQAAGASGMRAQVTDPYTGGVVGPATPCPPAAVSVSPSGVLAFDAPFTINTTGQRPNGPVDFYVNGVRSSSASADSNGTASLATRVPVGAPPKFDVSVAGACGTVTVVVDPAAASLVERELGRGFARTGLSVLALVLVGLALLVLGRFLVRQTRQRQPS